MNNAGVHFACLVAIAGHVPNADVQHVTRLHPDRFIPVGSINPASANSTEQAEQQIGQLADQGFAAVKLHPRLNEYDPLDERCLAAIRAAGEHELPVFLDTLFRQPGRVTRHPADVIDHIAKTCPRTSIVLLHSAGPSMLELFELGRMHAHLLLDLSFALLRYKGSSLDLDMRFLCEQLDQRVVFGSDFPEYLPTRARQRMLELTDGLPDTKRENVFFRNLERLFARHIDASSSSELSKSVAASYDGLAG
jgi:predicted TIM-barrel fold metal-dependent hydrolase